MLCRFKFHLFLLLLFIVTSCGSSRDYTYNYDVFIDNNLSQRIYVIDPDPDLIDLIFDDRTYALDPDDSVWFSWGEYIYAEYAYVEMEISTCTCRIRVREGYVESVIIDDAWLEDNCPDYIDNCKPA